MEFCWNFGFQISQFFDKISDLYNKTTQKFYNFFENNRQVKYKKKMSKIPISIFFWKTFYDFPKFFDKISNP